jgi:hypothetical protein
MKKAPEVDPITGLEGISELDLATLPPQISSFYKQIIGWGRMAPASINNAYRKLADQGGVQPRIADSPVLNAWAIKQGDGFVLGLYAATPIILHFAFNQMLRCPMVLTRIGDPAIEQPETLGYQHGIPLILPEQLPVHEACTVLPSVSRPIDDERATAASALTEIACAFATFHEVAHIIAGHTGFLAFRSDLALLELSGFRTHSAPSRLRRVWEYEADKIAAVMLLSFLVDPENRAHFTDVFHLPSNDTGYACGSAGIGIMAAYVLFLLLGQGDRKLRSRSIHPHPLVRMTSIHNAMRVCARDDLEIATADFDASVDEATTSIFNAWQQIGAPVPAVRRNRWDTPERTVQRQIERLQKQHEKAQILYADHSWIPMQAWKSHDS